MEIPERSEWTGFPTLYYYYLLLVMGLPLFFPHLFHFFCCDKGSPIPIFTTFRFYYYYFFVGSVSGLFVPVHLLFGPSLRSVPHDYWQWADGTRRMTRGERNPRNRKRLLISYFLRFLWRLLLSSFPSSIRSDRGTEVSEMGMGCGLVERGARVTGSSSSSNNLWALSNWSISPPAHMRCAGVYHPISLCFTHAFRVLVPG